MVNQIILHSTTPWQMIRRVESPSYAGIILASAYKRTGFMPPKVRIIEAAFAMSSTMVQMRTYFRAARAVDVSAQPILLYYGILHLAKAAAIIANPYYGDTLESHKHGLSIRRKTGSYDYFKDRIFIQKNGVFLDWYVSLQRLSNHWPITGLTVYGENAADHLAHVSLPVIELWRCIPDVSELLQILNKTTRCATVSFFIPSAKHDASVSERGYTVTGLSRTIDDWANNTGLERNTLEGHLTHYLQASSPTHAWSCIPRPFTGSSRGEYSDKPIDSQNETRYDSSWTLCVPPLSPTLLSTFTFPEPLVYFALIFQLSMLQRYEPLEWVSLINDPMSLEHMLIEILCNDILDLMPPLLARLLSAIEQTE